MLDNCLFEFVKVSKNSDPDKYKYNGYGIGYYSHSDFSFTGWCIGKMLLVLELIWAHLCILTIKIKIS